MDTLTRIRAFIDVVEAEGFSAAARKNGRSKALLSKYVRELEDDLGALLLNRTTRQFSLTEAGHTYYRSASDILKEIDNLADLVRETSRDLKGTVRVSAPRTFTDADIGQSMVDFAMENPEIKLEISSDDRFVDLVEEGFDVAIRITRLADSGLIARKLAPFKAYVCASPDFLKRHPELKEPADLVKVPCIMDTNARSLNNWQFRGKSGAMETVTVKGPIEVNSPTASMKAVRSGLGVSILPDFVVWPLLKSGEIVTLFEDRVPDDAAIYAVYPHRRYLPAKVRAFVDYLAVWFKQYGGYCDR
ncbi:LysR family transcriptional regulator [Hoeflea sp.]|uniref:LysR family transcriptional regulator n=1 Tax=Hoeflea sp. TaxID=1940281 RepID=UPI003B02AD90